MNIREMTIEYRLHHWVGIIKERAITVWVENSIDQKWKVLVAGEKLLMDKQLEIILFDVTESQVERPKLRQKRWYSGKKKHHIIKSQIVNMCKNENDYRCFCGLWYSHDFKTRNKLFGVKVVKHIKIHVDSGYQGIDKLHKNSETPKKNFKSIP